MTTEKRLIDKDNLAFNVSAVVVDIEGTTTSINFVKETLFPYAREHLEEYMKTKWADKELQEDVALLREQAIEDAANKVEGVVDIPEGDNEEVKKSVIKNVLWQMDSDRKVKSLKRLQGHIWKSAYTSGKIVGHLYDDVTECLKSWNEAGKKIYVYSSGSVEAQKLLFGNTKDGDLLSIFSGFFDTEVGPKTESSSYVKIVEKLKENGHVTSGAKDVLFLTDVLKEAQAALDVGIQTVIVVREGNAPLPNDIKGSFPTISSFSDLTFEGNAKRRKLCDENKSENVEGLNNIANDEEMEVCTNENSATLDSVSSNSLENANTVLPESNVSCVNLKETAKTSEIVDANSEETTKTPEPVNTNSEETTKTTETVSINSELTSKTSEPVSINPKGTAQILELICTNSEETPTIVSDPVDAKSEETVDPILDSAESAERTSANCMNTDPKQTSKLTSISGETKKIISDSINDDKAEKITEEIPDSELKENNTPSIDEIKTSSQVLSSSENKKIENGIDRTEVTKVEKVSLKGDISNDVDDKCTQKESACLQNSLDTVEGKVVDNDKYKNDTVNNPDSTVESDDVEMKEVVEESKPDESVKSDQAMFVEVMDNNECEEDTRVKETLKKEEIETEMRDVNKQEMVSEKDEIPEGNSKDNDEIREKMETEFEVKIDNQSEKIIKVERTSCNEAQPKDESISKNQQAVSDAEIDLSGSENDVDSKKRSESESNSENQKSDSKTESKIVTDNNKTEELKQTISDVEMGESASPVEKSENCKTNSIVGADKIDKKDNANEKVLNENPELENKEIADDKKPEDTQSSAKEIHGESENKQETSNDSCNVADHSENIDGKDTEHNREERLSKETEDNTVEKEPSNSCVEDKLVSNMVDQADIVKTENDKADNETVEGEKNDVFKKEKDSVTNKETANLKTDLNNSTPNGTHETSKNGLMDDNIPDKCSIGDKINPEKVKDCSTEQQNGVETAGTV